MSFMKQLGPLTWRPMGVGMDDPEFLGYTGTHLIFALVASRGLLETRFGYGFHPRCVWHLGTYEMSSGGMPVNRAS